MQQILDDSLHAGRAAAARGAWREAYELLSSVEGGAVAAGGEFLISKESLDGGARYAPSPSRELELKGIEHPVAVCSVAWR